MGVFDEYLVDPKLSLLDKTHIQAQVLVPVMRALRAELGQGKADAIVRSALRDWSKQLFAAIGDDIEGSPRRKWAAMHQALAEVTEREVTFDMLRQDEEALEFNITSCRFAEFFRALGEPELGALLVCETAVDIAAAGEGRVEFTRAQTIMQARRAAPSATSSPDRRLRRANRTRPGRSANCSSPVAPADYRLMVGPRFAFPSSRPFDARHPFNPPRKLCHLRRARRQTRGRCSDRDVLRGSGGVRGVRTARRTLGRHRAFRRGAG